MKFETPWCVIGGGEIDGYLSCVVNRDKGGIVVKEIDDGRRVCGDRSALDIGRLRKTRGCTRESFFRALKPYEIWEKKGWGNDCPTFIKREDYNIYIYSRLTWREKELL